MTARTVDQLVADYLARLDRAAGVLPPTRRDELIEEIRGHIESARAAGAAADEAAVRTMLDRLGEPEEIVAAAHDAEPSTGPGVAGGPAQPAVVAARPGTGLELAAVLLLTLGSFIPLLGWAVGAFLLWGARRWTTREKLLGTLVIPGGPGMVLWLVAFAPGQACGATMEVADDGTVLSTTEVCTGFALPAWLGVLLFIALLVMPFVVAGLLYSQARARAAAEEPDFRPVSPATSPWTGQEIAAVWLLATATVVALVGIVVLGIGSLPIAVAALVVGLILMWTSMRWTRREKVVGTVIAIAPAALFAIAGAILAFAAMGGSAAAVYLAVVLNRRRSSRLVGSVGRRS